jgi:hypothetical protein
MNQDLVIWDQADLEQWIGQPITGYDPYQRIDLDGVPPLRYFTLFP